MGPHLRRSAIFAVILIKIYVLSPLAAADALVQRYVTTDRHMSPPLKKNLPEGDVDPSNEGG